MLQGGKAVSLILTLLLCTHMSFILDMVLHSFGKGPVIWLTGRSLNYMRMSVRDIEKRYVTRHLARNILCVLFYPHAVAAATQGHLNLHPKLKPLITTVDPQKLEACLGYQAT